MMKVNIVMPNGGQYTAECTVAYPIENGVFIVEVLHFDDGTNGVDHKKIPGYINHVEVMDYDVEGYAYYEEGKRIGVIKNHTLIKDGKKND